MKETLANAQHRERQARRHGRHIVLEKELNDIGLSLLAPPLTGFREVSGNEWEGWSVPAGTFTLLPVNNQEREFLIEILGITRDIARPDAQDEPDRVKLADDLLHKLNQES